MQTFPRRSEKQAKHQKKKKKKTENVNTQSDMKTVKKTFQGS